MGRHDTVPGAVSRCACPRTGVSTGAHVGRPPCTPGGESWQINVAEERDIPPPTCGDRARRAATCTEWAHRCPSRWSSPSEPGTTDSSCPGGYAQTSSRRSRHVTRPTAPSPSSLRGQSRWSPAATPPPYAPHKGAALLVVGTTPMFGAMVIIGLRNRWRPTWGVPHGIDDVSRPEPTRRPRRPSHAAGVADPSP